MPTTPGSSDANDGGGALSQTGSGALFAGIGALALLVAGAAVFLLRRRRTQ